MRALSALFALPLALSLVVPVSAFAAPTRLKDLVEVQGVRDNQLFGYGLVVGLAGTGDTEQLLFTSQSISAMLGRLGVRVNPRDVRSRNVAAVMVTAKLPTFARAGTKIDVSVSSIGNARSIGGGVLLVTPLTGGDGQVYAVAQGPLQVGGYDVRAAGSALQKNTPTSGRIPSGATVERTVQPDLGSGPIVLSLRSPDFTTAQRIAEVVGASLGEGTAKATDPAAVEVTPTEALKGNPVALMAKLEALEIEAERRARVVVSERTGTVVAGENVRLRPAAVAHGGLRVTIAQRPIISQPAAFSTQGRTVETSAAQIAAEEAGKGAISMPGTASVDELVKALNSLGAAPRDLISILQALHAAGSLDAELEVI